MTIYIYNMLLSDSLYIYIYIYIYISYTKISTRLYLHVYHYHWYIHAFFKTHKHNIYTRVNATQTHTYTHIYIYIYTFSVAHIEIPDIWVECSPMVRKTWLQSQVTSCQRIFKRVLDITFLNAQQYDVRIKGKVEQSREKSDVLPYTSVL